MQISSLEWRAFGLPADLDVNFAGGTRNAVVTQLLAACRGDATLDAASRTAQAAALTLAGRIGALAAVVARTSNEPHIAVALSCTHAGCREPFEIELPLSWLLQQADEAEARRSVAIERTQAGALRLRRPTGEDQDRWLQGEYATADAAQRAVLSSLLEDTAAANALDQLDTIAAAMEELDPLPALRVRSACPRCEREAQHAVDLEVELLAQLRRRQSALLHAVHQLATRYGWNEREIAALPAWRRRAYIEMDER